MKRRLEEHFGNEIVITSFQRKENVVTLRTVTRILHEYHEFPKCYDLEKEKMQIVEVAAKLIKSDIRKSNTSKDTFPSSADIDLDNSTMFLPDSLKLLLNVMFVGKDCQPKLTAISQSIMQAVRPRLLIAPLQFGLGVQLHHHYASKYLIDILHNLGLCCRYKEIQRFEQNAAIYNESDIPEHSSDQFTTSTTISRP